MSWRPPTLPGVTPVPSARPGLTSLFGMGRGAHRSHSHHYFHTGCAVPVLCKSCCSAFECWFDKYGQEYREVIRALVVVRKSCGAVLCEEPTLQTPWGMWERSRAISMARLWYFYLYTCHLSTSSSLTALTGRSHLGVGFALRCFQRLSHPSVATLRCIWRYNRCTSGSSNPVLSY